MRITNKTGLPDAIVAAVKCDDYTRGDADYSISELLAPARMTALRRKHFDEIVEDASERVWSLFGKAVHKVAEMANVDGVVERRLFWDFDGVRVSGAIDYYDAKTHTISDYKTCSVYKLKNKDFSDWEAQQNCYAALSVLNNIPVKRIEIIAFGRDWRPSEAKREENYPPQSLVVELPLWSHEKALLFIKERIRAHEMAKKSLPICTPEERWQRPSTWAVKKRGGAKAVPGGLFADEEMAKKFLASLGSNYELEYRAGESVRCGYCAVSDFCDQSQ